MSIDHVRQTGKKKKREREESCLTCWHGSGTHDWWDISLTWTKQNKLVDCRFGSCWAARRLGTVAWRSWLRWCATFHLPTCVWNGKRVTGLLLLLCVCGAKATVSIYLHQYFFLLPPTVCTIFLTTIIFFASASYWSFWPFFLNKKGVLVTIGPPEMGGRRTDQNFW